MITYSDIIMAYELPMLECSNCGQHLGHMYNDYYILTKQLMEELKNTDVPRGTYITSYDDDISDYISTYYSWYQTQDVNMVPVHEPGNIVARALLRTRTLKPEHLPFGSATEADGQLSIHEGRICCMRMFQTDPKMTNI